MASPRFRLAAAFALLCTASVISACKRHDGQSGAGGRGGQSGGAGGGAGMASGAGGGAGMASGAGGGAGMASGAGGGAGAPAWLQDPTIWSPVAGGEDCGIAVLAANQPGPAARSWSSCGSGCLVAAATNLPGETGVGRTTASAGVIGGTAYLRVVSGSPQYTLALVTRLTDGSLIAGVKQTTNFSSCGMVASERAVLALPFMMPGQVALVGVVNPVAKAVYWSLTQPSLPLVAHVFANDAGWGMQFDDGSIRVLMPPKYPTLTTIDHSVVPTGQGAGLLDRMIWSSAEPRSDPEVVKGFTPTGGVQVLAAQATDNHTVAFSDRAAVWIGTTGPQRHEGNYETAQLFWAAWPDPLGPAAVQTGPSLPAPYGLLSLATAGDYAATIGCAQGGLAVDTCELFVVQMSTSKLWRIPRRSGGAFMDVMAVTSDEIVLSEIDFPNGYPPVIQRFVRFGLAHLDEMATAR